MHVFGRWEEAGEPGENPRIHGENMQTPHRKAPVRSWTWNSLAVARWCANHHTTVQPHFRNVQKIKERKSQINDLYLIEIQKKLTFLKWNYYEIGNKSVWLLPYKLRKYQTETVIYKNRDTVSKEIKYKNQEIHKCLKNDYRLLYSWKKETQLQTLLNTLNVPLISDLQNKTLLPDIQPKELEIAIMKLKANKSPGTDGFTAEWHKSFKQQLSPLLLRTFNHVLHTWDISSPGKKVLLQIYQRMGRINWTVQTTGQLTYWISTISCLLELWR